LEPKQAWQIDICQGLPPTKNSSSFLTMVDIYSGYVVATPLRKETSEEIAKILEENIFKIFGPPTEISSDNAANLNGPEIKRLLKFYNVKRSLTTPYSPESHGLVENCNRYITELVRILSDQFQTPWIDVISLASIMMNSIPRKSLLNHSPFFIMFK
jgi:transposase InsO family protein